MLLRLSALFALIVALALPATAQDLLRVTDDPATDTTRFAVDAGGGMHLVGNAASAAPTVLPNVPQFMWWPGRAALRIGTPTIPTTWTDPNDVGEYSVAIGESARASGNHAFAFGAGANASGDYSFAFGRNATAGNGGVTFSGRAELGFPGVFRATFGQYRFSTDLGSQGVFMNPGDSSWRSMSDSTQKENFEAYDADGVLDGLARLRVGTWNYRGQDAATMRHWGPMAQDIYREFGRDGYGTIGNDTTMTTQDADGILFAAAQALEARTREQAVRIAELEARLDAIEARNRAPLASGAPWLLVGLIGLGGVAGWARRRA